MVLFKRRGRWAALVLALLGVPALLGAPLLGAHVLGDTVRAQRPEWAPGLYWRYAQEAGGAADALASSALTSSALEYWVLGVRAIRGVDHYVLAARVRRDAGETIDLAFAPVRAPFPRGTNTPDSQTYLDFPLAVGRAWTVREAASAGFLSAAAITAEVEAFEPVDTGFGTFDSFRVRYEREGATWRVWYAPHALSWVRQTSPADGSAVVLQETWSFTLDHALNEVYATIERLLDTDRLGMRGLLNELIGFGFDAARAEALKARL